MMIPPGPADPEIGVTYKGFRQTAWGDAKVFLEVTRATGGKTRDTSQE
jgi:hypothetical protein